LCLGFPLATVSGSFFKEFLFVATKWQSLIGRCRKTLGSCLGKI
jgi:hypothetical protein